MINLQGKVALVTGASRGAGRWIVMELAKAGAYVYLTVPFRCPAGRAPERDGRKCDK